MSRTRLNSQKAKLTRKTRIQPTTEFGKNAAKSFQQEITDEKKQDENPLNENNNPVRPKLFVKTNLVEEIWESQPYKLHRKPFKCILTQKVECICTG